MNKHKTWVEIKKSAIRHNIQELRKLLTPKTKLWSVVKSNAYGHGLLPFSQIAEKEGVDGFCVDSVLEGLKLRENGLKKPILTLGPTLFKELWNEAEKADIALTVSNFDILKNLLKLKNPPKFYLKIDTGMHRQGFYLSEISKVIKLLRPMPYGLRTKLIGLYTHFASAKDINYPTYTELQFSNFQKAIFKFKKAGFSKLICSASATGGTLVNPKYHLDAVRIGIGLYGLWPSKEFELQRKDIKLKSVLSWHSLISEIKMLKKGDYVGYDLAERVFQPTKMGIIPIGYWHGLPRAFSGSGEILINGKRAKILGRISMDLIAVNLNGISAKIGDKATIIGRQKTGEISAFESAQKISTIHYELLTRINPLIERKIT